MKKKKSENKRLDKIPKQYRESVIADLIAIAQKIKKRREAKDLTQEECAELLHIEPTTLQAIEQLRGKPSLELLLTIIKVLEMKITLK